MNLHDANESINKAIKAICREHKNDCKSCPCGKRLYSSCEIRGVRSGLLKIMGYVYDDKG